MVIGFASLFFPSNSSQPTRFWDRSRETWDRGFHPAVSGIVQVVVVVKVPPENHEFTCFWSFCASWIFVGGWYLLMVSEIQQSAPSECGSFYDSAVDFVHRRVVIMAGVLNQTTKLGGWPAQFLKNGGFSYDCFLLEWHRLSGAILSIRALRGCVNSMFPPSPSKQWKKWRYKVEISSMIASLVPGSPILSCIAQRNNEVICWTTGGHTRPFQKWLLFRWINPHHFPPPQKIDSNHVKKMLIKQNAKKG